MVCGIYDCFNIGYIELIVDNNICIYGPIYVREELWLIKFSY